MAVSGRIDFSRAFEISPIYLTGGAASGISGGTLPLLSLTEGTSFTSLISGGSLRNLDDFFAHFIPLQGGSLVMQKVGTYPFANQATAANAVIADPINISLMMICPVRSPGEYSRKQAVISALKATLDQHNSNGGTYSVNTPAFLYTNCLLTRLVDISSGESHQAQWRFQWDFMRPLISLAEATAAQNNLMGKISSGSQVTPTETVAPDGTIDREILFSSADNTIGNPAAGSSDWYVPSNTPDAGLGFGGFNTARSGDSATTIPAGPTPPAPEDQMGVGGRGMGAGFGDIPF